MREKLQKLFEETAKKGTGLLGIGFKDMNTINEMEERGFIRADDGRELSLHPMMQEVTIADLVPGVESCFTMLLNIQDEGSPPEYTFLHIFSSIASLVSSSLFCLLYCKSIRTASSMLGAWLLLTLFIGCFLS